MCLALAWKLLIRKEVWLRGMDLNHRPLGYEFDVWSLMGFIAPNGQQLTSSTFLLVLIASESRVSNLLAIPS